MMVCTVEAQESATVHTWSNTCARSEGVLPSSHPRGQDALDPRRNVNTYMEIEHLFRSTALALGLKPSASQGEARLRGLERIIFFQRP